MKDYFMDLGKYVLEGFGAVGQITIHYDMIPTELDIDTDVPLGLIVNELLTNSLKHAFPGKKTGNVTLSLTPLQGSRMLLAYEDDGIGSQAKDTEKKGFGLSLIELLTYQISGKMEKKKATGTRIELDFKLPKTA
jgi:two-component sensor histidine kinase